MTPSFSAVALLGTITIAAADNLIFSTRKRRNNNSSSSSNDDPNKKHQPLEKRHVKTTLCSTQDCNDYNGEAEQLNVCKTYLTPISNCYNAKYLFPNDESWGDVDILDELHYRPEMKRAPPELKRTFYTSKDGSCVGVDYSWIQPFEVCEGPFGKPRPWGKFSLVDDDDDVVEKW